MVSVRLVSSCLRKIAYSGPTKIVGISFSKIINGGLCYIVSSDRKIIRSCLSKKVSSDRRIIRSCLSKIVSSGLNEIVCSGCCKIMYNGLSYMINTKKSALINLVILGKFLWEIT